MDFIDAVTPNQGVEVFNQWIPRARFGDHIRLGRIAGRVNQALEAGQAREAAGQMSAYFSICGFKAGDLDGDQLLAAYRQLQELNGLRYFLPFQLWQPPELESPPYDYPGRQWAWWVHKLASRYGWSRNDIFDLWPEEAAAYLQEILVTEFEEADDRRALSELGYHYDKNTGKASFRPLPRPGWMVKQKEPETIRMRREMLPVGNVIDLSQVA